jgi:hypothetical protein
MIEQDIVNYIILAQKHGLSELEIKQNLLNAGWQAGAVEENFTHAKALLDQSGAVRMPETKMPDNAVAARFATDQSSTLNQITITTATGPVGAGGAFSVSQDGVAQNPAPSLVSQPEKQNFFKKPLFWISIVVILALAAAAYGYYNYYYTTPAKILGKISSNKPETFQADYVVAYLDGQASSSPNFSLSVSGSGAYDFSDAKNLKTNQSINVNLGSGGLSYSLKFNYLVLSQVLYVDVSQIDLLKQLMPGQNLQWLKLDLTELQQYISQNASSTSISSNQLNDPKLKAKLQTIWSNNKILTAGTFLAREKIGQTAVYHIKPQLDTPALSQAVQDSLSAIAASGADNTGQFTDQDKQAINSLISKIKIKELDLWVSQKDGYIYRFHLISNAPSQHDFSNQALVNTISPLSDAQAKSRDAKRLADVRQIESALVLYSNDYGGYPAGQNNGQPQNLSSKYIDAYPTAPEPADGNCTDYYNSYWYKTSGQPKTVNGQTVYPSFTMTFCLGALTGGFNAGIGMLTPQGIQSNITCTDTPQHCVNQNPGTAASAAALSAVNQMDFAGQITADITYSNYGKAQTFTAPDNAVDLIQLIKNEMQSGTQSIMPTGNLPNQ